MATIEMVDNPADGAANPGGHFHATEFDNLTRGANGHGVLGHTLSLTVTGGDRVVTVPAVGALVPDGSGGTQYVSYAGGTVTIAAADASDPRTDIGTLDADGNVGKTDGVATTETGDVEEAPMPALAADEILLFKVRAEANTSNIGTDKVVGRAIDISENRPGRAVQEFVEGQVASLYHYGGGVSSAGSGTLIGLGFVTVRSGTSTFAAAPHANLPGGTQMTVRAVDDDSGLRGSGYLAAADDWVIGCRIKQGASAAKQDFFLGLKASVTAFSSKENNLVGIRLSGTGNYIGVSDSGGNETTRDTSNNDTSEHTLRIEISGGGTIVRFFFDDSQVGADVTTNIPPRTDLVLACGVTGSDDADHSFFMSDLYAFRGN